MLPQLSAIDVRQIYQITCFWLLERSKQKKENKQKSVEESRQMPSEASWKPEVIASTKLSSSIATRYFGGHNDDAPSGLSSQP